MTPVGVLQFDLLLVDPCLTTMVMSCHQSSVLLVSAVCGHTVVQRLVLVLAYNLDWRPQCGRVLLMTASVIRTVSTFGTVTFAQPCKPACMHHCSHDSNQGTAVHRHHSLRQALGALYSRVAQSVKQHCNPTLK